MMTLCRLGSGGEEEVTTCIGAELQNVRIDFHFCAQVSEVSRSAYWRII